jgi:hypothetical protein
MSPEIQARSDVSLPPDMERISVMAKQTARLTQKFASNKIFFRIVEQREGCT